MTAVPRDHDGFRSGLFQEFLKATDVLADTGFLAKDTSGWSLTASGRAAAGSASGLDEALERMEVCGGTSRAIDTAQQPAASDPSDRLPRCVGLAGGFLPAGSTDQQPWRVSQRSAWVADDPGLQLAYDAEEDVWATALAMEPGHYEYKVVLDSSWRENYGVRGMRSGPNLVLDISTPSRVTFTFDHVTKLPMSR